MYKRQVLIAHPAGVPGRKTCVQHRAGGNTAGAGRVGVGIVHAHVGQRVQIDVYKRQEDGYGESPLHTYRTVSRLAEAGAMAVMIDDTTGIRLSLIHIFAHWNNARWRQRY